MCLNWWCEPNRTEAKRTALQKSRSVGVLHPNREIDMTKEIPQKRQAKLFGVIDLYFGILNFSIWCVCIYERQPHSTPEMSWYIAIIFEHIYTLSAAYIKSNFTSNTHTHTHFRVPFCHSICETIFKPSFFYAFLTPSTSPPPPFEYIASQPVKSTHNPKHMFDWLTDYMASTKLFPFFHSSNSQSFVWLRLKHLIIGQRLRFLTGQLRFWFFDLEIGKIHEIRFLCHFFNLT